jgi:hypothetical protein
MRHSAGTARLIGSRTQPEASPVAVGAFFVSDGFGVEGLVESAEDAPSGDGLVGADADDPEPVPERESVL